MGGAQEGIVGTLAKNMHPSIGNRHFNFSQLLPHRSEAPALPNPSSSRRNRKFKFVFEMSWIKIFFLILIWEREKNIVPVIYAFIGWFSFLKKKILFIYFLRGEGREKERVRNISVWFPLACPLPGTRSTTQAHALTGNRPSEHLVCLLYTSDAADEERLV